MKVSIIWKKPASLVFYFILKARYFLYDLGFIKRYIPPVKTLAAGNLSLGGSGKTPFVLWMLSQLEEKNRIAILSRGYKRKSNGFRYVSTLDPYDQVGDEPLMMKLKAPEIIVAVAENRQMGIKKILQDHPHIQYILLDDALQHLQVQAHSYFLLSRLQHPFYRDTLFPMGTLRDLPERASRADFLVFTDTGDRDYGELITEVGSAIPSFPPERILFTETIYEKMRNIWDDDLFPYNTLSEAVIICGIAEPSGFIAQVAKMPLEIRNILLFPDHHAYTYSDFDELALYKENKEILFITTEKDAVRIKALPGLKSYTHFYYLPISLAIKTSSSNVNKLQTIFMT